MPAYRLVSNALRSCTDCYVPVADAGGQEIVLARQLIGIHGDDVNVEATRFAATSVL